MNIESGSADCLVARAVRFPRKTFQTETGAFYVFGPGGSKSLVRRTRARGEDDDESSAGLGTGEPARHAPRYVGLQDLTFILFRAAGNLAAANHQSPKVPGGRVREDLASHARLEE